MTLPLRSPAVLIPLFSGVMLYWAFRGISIVRLPPIIQSHNAVVAIMAYNVPDGLWLYSLLQALRSVWNAALFSKGLPWLCIAIAGAFLSEVAQLHRMIPGTYDALDIVVYTLAALVFILQYYRPVHSLKPTI